VRVKGLEAFHKLFTPDPACLYLGKEYGDVVVQESGPSTAWASPLVIALRKEKLEAASWSVNQAL
jgi:hypothetical protein